MRNATVVNAMDGDGVLYQDDLDALGVRILPGYNSGFSNHNMPYTTGEVPLMRWKTALNRQLHNMMLQG